MAMTWSVPCLVFDCGDDKRTMQVQTPTTGTISTNKLARTNDSHGGSKTTLPDDILVDIFSRLPAKSVGRLRCLSRSWTATLKSALFVDLHLHQANHHRPMPKLFVTAAHLSDKNANWSVEVLTKPCHGLVLLHRPPQGGHYVYNPSTGQLLPLPDSEARGQRYGASYGLGYCPATTEHKVVRILASSSCEVFTLDVSAHWTAAAQKPPSRVEWSPATFCCDGYLHFLLEQQGGTGTGIVAFNVGDETFGSLTVPASARDSVLRAELTVLDGSLCLCVFHNCWSLSDVDPYCIWRLACREAGRWEKLYRVLLQPQLPKPELDLLHLRWLSPLAIYRAGNRQKNNKIMFATEEGVLELDLRLHGGDIPKILVAPNEIAGNEIVIRTGTVGLMEESLVSVGHTSDDTIYSSPWRKAWSDILKWLPTRSVVGLMCVCKEWRALISSNRFMQEHTLHANLGQSHKIKLVSAHPYYDVSYYPLESCLERLQMPFLLDQGRFRIVCSRPCHGLVLASYTYKVVNKEEWYYIDYLCNPSREYSSHIYPDQGTGKDVGTIGLGYDSRTNKHVLVRLVCYRKGSRDYQLECCVLLTDTTSWISISPPPRPVVADKRPAYAHGKLYWMVDSEIATKSSELLALDVGTREFDVIGGPPCNRDRITSITELRGNICILCSDSIANAIDVWTLEGGLWSTWNRIHLGESRQIYSSHETMLLDVDPIDGRILLSTGRALGYYDPKTRALQTIYSLGEDLQRMEFAPMLYQESLLRPRT